MPLPSESRPPAGGPRSGRARQTVATGLFVLLLLLPGRAAFAQTGGTWLNLGVRTTWFGASSSNHTNNVGWGIAYRFGTGKTGWGPSLGFNWFQTTLKTDIAGRQTPLASVHVRPIMAGYGYTWKRGRLAVEAKGSVGYAFNDLEFDDAARQAYLDRLGTYVSGGVRNSLVLKPEVNVWYDIAPRVGVNLSVGYLYTHPEVHLTTLAGTTTAPYSADMVVVSVGVVYGIF
ncbi:MAG: hypothetical protein KGN76_14370 [Acidobacteriota bacterium]|nr:hypothetical protein [Acidobacteriota bacterium]